jgi:hypothetical protein
MSLEFYYLMYFILQKEVYIMEYNVPLRVFGWMLDECTDHPLHG